MPIILLVYDFNINDLNHCIPTVCVFLLYDFKDIVPDEFPSGLSLIRGIEHQIDFVSRASILNWSAYMSNPEKTNELQRKEEELMTKGYIRESISPCVVPILLIP
jgi:hypothetical protein